MPVEIVFLLGVTNRGLRGLPDFWSSSILEVLHKDVRSDGSLQGGVDRRYHVDMG